VKGIKQVWLHKGFTGKARIDYHETFCFVVKSATIHLILFVAVSSIWSIRPSNVKNAFLYGHLI